jgi:hypothetical protein
MDNKYREAVKLEDTLLETQFTVFRVFLIITLVAFGIFFMKESPIKDITKAYTEIACAKGGITDQDITTIKRELGKQGYDPNYVSITITSSDGSKALNPTATDYVRRGNLITLNITYNKLSIIDGIFKYLGSSTDTVNKCTRYGMSEKR